MTDNETKAFRLAVIENIFTLVLAAFLFWLTKSAWCFLVLFNLNTFKPKKRDE